jgi:hypothetical protein
MAAAYRGDRFGAMLRAAMLALVCTGGHALASPRSDPTSGRAVFTGATMQTESSIDLDPAAIGPGLTTELLIYVTATSVIDHYTIMRDHLDLATGAVSPGTTIRDTELGPGGTFGLIWHFNDRATLGFEAKSPPAEVFISDRDSLGYHTLGGGQRTYSGGVGVSFKVSNDFYFGLSLATSATTLHLHYARDTALDNGHGPNGIDSDCGGSPCGVENPEASEHYDINVRSSYFSTSNLVVNIGIMLQLAKDMWLGIAYHSPPGLEVQTALTGSMDVRQAPRDGGVTLHGDSTVFLSQPASADAELRARVQPDLDLHVGLRWEDLSRLSSYDVRGYGSVFPSHAIPEWTLRPRGFHDPFSVWAGIEQPNAGQWWYRLGARIGVETSSLPDEKTSPQSIAPRSYTADAGIEFKAGAVRFQLSYGIQYFPTVDVTNSAYDPRARITCIDSGYDYETAACAAVRDGYGIPTADGTYDRLEHAVRIGFVYEY